MGHLPHSLEFRVIWSEEDTEHVGLCDRFPSLSWCAETPDEALKGIRSLVEEVMGDMKESGELANPDS